ncbi:MAG: hypothetical protein AAFX50_17030, partial [Acidobacteriota bacterium]
IGSGTRAFSSGTPGAVRSTSKDAAVDYALQVSETAFAPGGAQPDGGLLFDGVVSGTAWTSPTDLPEGPIFWRLASRDAVGNQSGFSAADDFTVDVTPPDVPILTPVTPDPTSDRRPSLGWGAVADAVAYRVQVSTDPGFATTLHDVSIAATAYTPGADLPEGAIYWRVASRDVAENDSAFSAAETFEVDVTPPGVPTPVAVTPDPTSNRRPPLSWGAVPGAADYRVQVATDAGFTALLVDVTVAGIAWTPQADLPDGPIFWRVASRDAPGNASAFSSADAFTIDSTPPDTPVLNPVTPDPTTDPRPTLSWNAVNDAVEYRLVMDFTGRGAFLSVTIPGNSFVPTEDLPDGRFSWFVFSRDALGNESAASTAGSFTVDTTPPEVPVPVAVTPDPTTDPRPTLAWGASADAADYRVQVATDAGFAALVFDVTVAGTTWTPQADLPDGPIFWRVASRDAPGNASAFSAADAFTVDATPPDIPVLNPVTPDPTTDPRPTLSWNA